MAFTVSDFRDLVTLLQQHPEWRAELRPLILAEELLQLPATVSGLTLSVKELTEAQKRTEQQIQELAEAQKRTEQQIQELAEAQKRTEQQVNRIAMRIEDLADMQKRMGGSLTNLERIFGVTVEEEAADVLRVVLEDKGYRVLGQPLAVRWDGDVDVAVGVTDPQGQTFTAVVEAKARLSWRDVEAWAKRIRSSGYRKQLEAANMDGPYLVYAYGMRLDVASRKAAEEFQVGLLTARGEELPPAIVD